MKQSAKRYSPLQVALIGGAIATTATVSVFGPGWCRSVRAALQDSPKQVVDQVWQLVNREYVDGSFNRQNWLTIRQSLLSRNYSSREEAYTAIREALQKLGDPYTRFMDPKQFEALTNQTSGEVSGIGIRMEVNENSKRLVVVEALENSPAIKAGIKPGDEIVAIDGKSTRQMKIEDASKLIRGRAGTMVTLRLEREGHSAFDLKLTRATIEVPTVRYALKQEGRRRVGYIRLREFNAHAADQMRRAIRDLNGKQVDGFVLDLRGNPGGLLQASIEIARMWIDNGPIVRTVDRRGGSDESKANHTALTNRPLVVLVDNNSASASEILTGALKDNKRAIVVGSQTFGKALVQSVHELGDGSGVAITIAHYYTPKGTDINHKGITPDIKLDLTEEQQRQLASNPDLLGTNKDPQYTRALNILSNNQFAQPLQNQTTQKANSFGADNLRL
ncbi:carboxyl-terminal processing protease CtpB [Fischerella thermalis]|jgi:carboxyl-terminal processing protease|uniref:Carboxyl-terminal-processing protease n=1 Tax=Fischerella thermalis JSC-11 TaxID=741277 RepID=G6FXA2_9CYAN|nr:carboxyl-terminal processing protease CtpB [Fischerella thermalis]PLZ97951.1 peptidase S41 [Fischerella thermalis CCMEE 5328]PMB08201.1 peptidase S41 [Fischerella thermalis CCMEE 5273]EHC10562.1 carboxyl-terminal protease [Fischerella thermalis JSC-11]PLZ04539.1 peptidase S41 [Fischerella thermalis WC119]PLZ13545.1 peptidase S41 [Fischerella thermalis WC1110]